MTGIPIVTPWSNLWKRLTRSDRLPPRHDLHTLWCERAQLQHCFRTAPTALRLLDLLGPLHWAGFPERDLLRNWGQPTIPYATLAATVLVQLNEGRVSMRQWPIFLEEQPVSVWLLGYPLAAAPGRPWDMDPRASLPANSIARVKPTRASTSSAQPPEASTIRSSIC